MARIDAAAGRLSDLPQQFDVLGSRVVHLLNVFVIDPGQPQSRQTSRAEIDVVPRVQERATQVRAQWNRRPLPPLPYRARIVPLSRNHVEQLPVRT